jgi:hypothetical protein
MRVRHLALIGSLAALAGCGGPSLETRTFELRYLDERTAEGIIQPYVYRDRPKSPGVFSVTSQTITVRETRDNLERIGRVLAEQDRPPANVRLVFTVIQADGAGPVDSTIAPIEAQLRRLFRFRGYRVRAQAVTVATERTTFRHILFVDRDRGGRDRFEIMGVLEAANVRGDSGVVRVQVGLSAPELGAELNTRLSIGLGQTAVLGGQPGRGEGALILAVRPELAAP